MKKLFFHRDRFLGVDSEFAEVDFAQAPVGKNEINALYGTGPVRVGTVSKGDFIWYRQGSTSGSPKVVQEFLVRKQFRVISPDDVIVNSMYSMRLNKRTPPIKVLNKPYPGLKVFNQPYPLVLNKPYPLKSYDHMID